jgi:hypothetical protein
LPDTTPRGALTFSLSELDADSALVVVGAPEPVTLGEKRELPDSLKDPPKWWREGTQYGLVDAPAPREVAKTSELWGESSPRPLRVRALTGLGYDKRDGSLIDAAGQPARAVIEMPREWQATMIVDRENLVKVRPLRAASHELRIRVVDKDGAPVEGIELQIDGASFTSDEDGILVDVNDLPGSKPHVAASAHKSATSWEQALRLVSCRAQALGKRAATQKAPPSWYKKGSAYRVIATRTHVIQAGQTISQALADARAASPEYARTTIADVRRLNWGTRTDTAIHLHATTGFRVEQTGALHIDNPDSDLVFVEGKAGTSFEIPGGVLRAQDGTPLDNLAPDQEHVLVVEPLPPMPKHKLRVKVVDDETGYPIPGVYVSVDGADFTTNDDGVAVDRDDLLGALEHPLQPTWTAATTFERALRPVRLMSRGFDVPAEPPPTEKPKWLRPNVEYHLVSTVSVAVVKNRDFASYADEAKKSGHNSTIGADGILRFNWGDRPKHQMRIAITETTGCRVEASGTDFKFVEDKAGVQIQGAEAHARFEVPRDHLTDKDGARLLDLVVDKEHVIRVRPIDPAPRTPLLLAAKVRCEHAKHDYLRPPETTRTALWRAAEPLGAKSLSGPPKDTSGIETLHVVPTRSGWAPEQPNEPDTVTIFYRNDLDLPPAKLTVEGPQGKKDIPLLRTDGGQVAVYELEVPSEAPAVKGMQEVSWSDFLTYLRPGTIAPLVYEVNGLPYPFRVKVYYPHRWKLTVKAPPVFQQSYGQMWERDAFKRLQATRMENEKKLREQAALAAEQEPQDEYAAFKFGQAAPGDKDRPKPWGDFLTPFNDIGDPFGAKADDKWRGFFSGGKESIYKTDEKYAFQEAWSAKGRRDSLQSAAVGGAMPVALSVNGQPVSCHPLRFVGKILEVANDIQRSVRGLVGDLAQARSASADERDVLRA